MARTRSIKPGFFKNEDLAELPYQDRLCFAGLWTLADREGRLEDRPRRIRGDLFPYDHEIDMEACLLRLDAKGFIVRYESGGQKYISIPKWNLHQKPHNKEQPSVIPDRGEPLPRQVQAPTQVGASPLLAAPSTLLSGLPSTLNTDEAETDFSTSDWVESVYARHPKKRDKSLAEGALVAALKSGKLTPVDFDRTHAAWCATEEWTKNNGYFAPKLAEWVSDEGYRYMPHNGTSAHARKPVADETWQEEV